MTAPALSPDPAFLELPFTVATARAAGVSREHLRRLHRSGVVRRVLPGVYVGAHVDDTLAARVAALRLVLPAGGVVVDETAAWLHGAQMVLQPGSHVVVPPVHVFQSRAGHRLRHDLTASGERRLVRTDLQAHEGLLVTTPLRTACDLGRLRHRDRAIAALDSLLRLEDFALDDLLREINRFKGYRGVVQLRLLAPLGDARAESPPESALRLRWLDAGLPAPVPQLVVAGPGTSTYRLDLALPEVMLAVEYDGQAYHSTPTDQLADAERRDWLRAQGWTVVVVRAEHLFGPHQCAEEMIRAAYRSLSH